MTYTGTGRPPELSREYRSKLANWHNRASVRVKPRRTLASDERIGLYFPPELHPIASHPLVAARPAGTVQRLLLQRLYSYLRFTVELEELAVMPVAMQLSTGRSGLDLPPGMRRDAFKIVTDEAWHAQFSDDLSAQVESAAGVSPNLPGVPLFLTELVDLRQRIEPGLRPASQLLFSVVSETLISSVLTDIPRDHRLPRAVREVVADHAEDEGKHHAYFHSLLHLFWHALSAAERRNLGPLVPDLIRVFLQPDFPAIVLSLFDAGLSDAEVEQVMAESYPGAAVTANVATAAQPCVRYFSEVGALDDPETLDAFQRAGLRP